MKKILYLTLVMFAACSPQNKTEAVENAASAAEVTHQQKNAENDAGSDTVKMTGTVHFSFEEAEFVAQGKNYFVEKGYGLILEVQKKRKYSGSYNVTLHNVCIQGKVLTKEQNGGHGFGPLGRYDSAVAVEKLC